MASPRSTLEQLASAMSVLLVACAAAVFGSSLAAFGDDAIRPEDQIWLVSTRHADSEPADSVSERGLEIRRYDAASHQWEVAEWPEFFRGQAATDWTATYVHGNRVEPGEDEYHGLAWYHTILKSRPDLPSMQMVIWSWPSSQIHGQLRDVRLKYWRARREVEHLGAWLRQFPAQRPELLIGFSYGGLIVPGALAELARSSSHGPAEPRRSALLLAAAEPICWLMPDQPHGAAFEAVRRMYVLINRCDPALKRFHAVDKCSRPIALGFAGIDESYLSNAGRERIEQWDVSSAIGKIHDEHPYRGSPAVHKILAAALDSVVPHAAEPAPSTAHAD